MIREALNQRPQLGVGLKEQHLNFTSMSIDIKKAVSNKLVLTRLPQIIFSTGNKITPLVFNLLVVLPFCKELVRPAWILFFFIYFLSKAVLKTTRLLPSPQHCYVGFLPGSDFKKVSKCLRYLFEKWSPIEKGAVKLSPGNILSFSFFSC